MEFNKLKISDESNPHTSVIFIAFGGSLVLKLTKDDEYVIEDKNMIFCKNIINYNMDICINTMFSKLESRGPVKDTISFLYIFKIK